MHRERPYDEATDKHVNLQRAYCENAPVHIKCRIETIERKLFIYCLDLHFAKCE